MQPLQLPVGISTPPPRSASSSARHRRTPSAGSATSAHRGATAAGGVVKDAVQVGRGDRLAFWLSNFNCQLHKTNMEEKSTKHMLIGS